MPFRNPILGGDYLIRPAVISPNYVPGVSGWIIRKDGSAEFNDVDVRGSVTVGPDPGAHIIVDSVHDAILVYDSGNNLIASISPTTQTISGISVKAGVTVYSALDHNQFIRLVGDQMQLADTTSAPGSGVGLISVGNLSGHSGQAGIALRSGDISGNTQSVLQLFSESGDTTQVARAVINQTNLAGVNGFGGVVQTTTASDPYFKHTDKYNITTDVNGRFNVAHGCGFTPTKAIVTQSGTVFGTLPIHTIILETGFTGTNFAGEAYNGAALFTSNNYDAYVEFWG